MNKYVLKATALAIGALVGGTAVADTNLDTGALTGTTAFASELNYNSTATPAGTAITNSAAPIVSSKLGFGVSGGQNRYIRVDLTNAKLNVAATAAALATAAAPAFANVTVVQGGAVGDSFVVFQITAAAGGHASSQTVNVTVPAIDVISTGSKVSISYKLFETAVDAANNSSATLYSKSGDLYTFSAGLKYALTTGTNTVSVEKTFKEFSTTATPASLSATLARLGTITYGVNAVAKADGTSVALTDLVTNATKLVVTGDFTDVSGAGGVFVSNSATCAASAAAGTLNTGKTSADIVVGTTAGGLPASQDYALCYQILASNNANSVAIPAQTITAALDLTAASGSAAADVPAATVGTILRDGTELIAPFATIHPDYVSRVFLTSTHSADAAVTATATADDGSTCASGVTLPALKAGKQMEYKIADICPSISGSGNTTRLSVRFTIAAPKSKISGAYNQYLKAISGAAAGAYGSKTSDMNNYVLVAPAN